MKATLILKQDVYDPKTDTSEEKSCIIHMIGGSSSIQITPEYEPDLRFYKPTVLLSEFDIITDQRVDFDIRDAWLRNLTDEDLDEIIHELIMLREQKRVINRG